MNLSLIQYSQIFYQVYIKMELTYQMREMAVRKAIPIYSEIFSEVH